VPWMKTPGPSCQPGNDFDTVDLSPSTFTPSGTPPELGVCDQPLVVLSPPSVTIAGCHLPTLQPPVPFSACGPVSVGLDAPADFPLGGTTITWRFTDALGNIATVTQTVNAALGDDSSCCPAGTNIIVGTSNNDNITEHPAPIASWRAGAKTVSTAAAATT
jgi:hypothetical protein